MNGMGSRWKWSRQEWRVSAELRAFRPGTVQPGVLTLQGLQADGNTEKLENYAKVLYDQALLIEGLPLQDPVALRLSGVTVTLRNKEADYITVTR